MTTGPARAPARESRLGLALLGIALAAATAGAWFVTRPRPLRTPAPAASSGPEDAPGRPSVPIELPPPTAVAPPTHAAEEAEALSRAVAGEARDAQAVAGLAARIDAGRPIGPDDLRVAEELFARYPDEARGLIESALVLAAFQHQQARRFAEARDLLTRAVGVAPRSVNVRRGLMAVLAELGDWPGVESAARGLLALAPDDPGATKTLAYSMVRQDRTRDAIETLTAYLGSHADAEAAALLEKLRRERRSEGGFEEQRLAHFHVRYDGEEHEDVGREILRVLDRHYATLRTAFDHEPAGPIPVTLFSTQSYYDATGAPAWAGGEYDHFDGRIRVPIGGLTSSLSPDLESTLLHECTHAFVTSLSGGTAPREVQEGLAQWTEGKRSETMLGDRGMRALADGRIRGVTGFYLASLVLVEDLIAQRGRSGINDLLGAMNRTRDVDSAFQEVYGRGFSALEEETLAKLRQRHGS
ncbi:MAG: hypothetical protein U0599_03335 [Vicinamibacteria bacterium]